MLQRVEGDDADGVVELPRDQIGDDRLEICTLDFGLAVDAAKAAKAVDHEVNRLIRAIGHDRRGPACFRHKQLPQTQTLRWGN